MEAAKQRKDMKGVEKPRNPQPLAEAALNDKDCQICVRMHILTSTAYESIP